MAVCPKPELTTQVSQALKLPIWITGCARNWFCKVALNFISFIALYRPAVFKLSPSAQHVFCCAKIGRNLCKIIKGKKINLYWKDTRVLLTNETPCAYHQGDIYSLWIYFGRVQRTLYTSAIQKSGDDQSVSLSLSYVQRPYAVLDFSFKGSLLCRYILSSKQWNHPNQLASIYTRRTLCAAWKCRAKVLVI